MELSLRRTLTWAGVDAVFRQGGSVPAVAPRRRLAVLVALTAVYFVAGKLGLHLAFVHPSATAVWPPTGIALAALLLLGRWAWPAVLAGAFLVNVTTAGGPLVSLGIAAGNTLEALLGSYLVERWADGRQAFDQPANVVKFTVLAGLLSTTVAATIGVASLALGGAAPWSRFGVIWVTWWLGDAGGVFVVAPLLLLSGSDYGIPWDLRRAAEAAALTIACLLISGIVFGPLLSIGSGHYPIAFLPFTALVWAAMRFGRRGAALAVALVYAVALGGTLSGFGPFARYSPNDALLLLQVFTCVASVMALMLAAVMLERRRMAAALRQAAVTDPLTGLANYRELIAVLEVEVQRSLRTDRPFAVLFLDVDRLKVINDHFGHLTGSQALCRVAEVLRRASRSIDTAARYGGDEFALVLPETDEEAADQVARRVTALLAGDAGPPSVTVSLGVAMFPRHGETADRLLAAADRGLYAAKGRVGTGSRFTPPPGQ